MNKLAIFGTGGFAKELLDIALDQGYTEIVFLEIAVQPDQVILGFPIMPESELTGFKQTDFIIGVADPVIRKKIYERYSFLHYPNLIHSQATLGYKVRESLHTSKGVVIAAGARVTNSCQFGDFVIVSFNSTVGHDCRLESYVSIMPGVNVSGCVHLMAGVYVGTNASVLPGRNLNELQKMGEYSVIGAGSVVLKEALAYTTYIGTPAKELKKQ